jgi:tRNA(fMet)-specific endonuclease VapC
MEIAALLLDTNAYSAFRSGKQEIVQLLLKARSIAVNTVVLGELYGGFAAGTRDAQNRADLAEFLALPHVSILPITAKTADVYGSLFAALRAAGTPVLTNDLWIAASAVENDLRLVSDDSDFRVIPGVQVGSSASDFDTNGA